MLPHLEPSDELSKAEVYRGLAAIVADGLATHAMVTLTGGVFLVAYALALGASNAVIGLLAAIPPLGALIQLPAVAVVERIRNRRLICVASSAISRLLWVAVALIPFLAAPSLAIPLLVAILACYAVISSVGHCSWSSWMHDLVPREMLGGFFSRRMALSIAFGVFLALAAGAFVDAWQGSSPGSPATGYSILFLVGSAAGLLGIVFLARIPEPRLAICRQVPIGVLFRESFADGNFRHLLSFLALWNFAVNLAAPFFTVYLLAILKLDIALVVALAVLSQVVSVASFHLWGFISDTYSNKSVLRVSGPLFMICILGWTFTTLPGEYALTMPLLVVLHILMGAATAGITLATGNIGMKLASGEAATAQLATISVTNSLVAAVAPVIGGLTIDYVALHELDWILVWRGGASQVSLYTLSLQNWDFFFVLAFAIGLYSLHRLAYVREEGEVGNRVVVRELVAQVRREMRNFSTVGGLRYMLHLPIAADRRVCETPPVESSPNDIDLQP